MKIVSVFLPWVLTLRDIVVYMSRQFLIALKRLRQNQSLFVYHWHQGQRNGNDKAENQLILIAQGFEGIRQTLYLGSGVGIYQGEAITIQQWALSNPPHWVIGKLRSSDLGLFGTDIVCELLQMALIIAHHSQSSPERNDLQSPSEITLLHNCPHTKQRQRNGTSFSGIYESGRCALISQLLEYTELPSLEYSTKCPFERIIGVLNKHVNRNRGEPLLL